MLVVIVDFSIKEGKEAEFLDWFAWSNEEFAKFKGFIRRRLLKPKEEGNYKAVIEFENLADFKAVGESPFHDVSAQRILPMLQEKLAPKIFEELMG